MSSLNDFETAGIFESSTKLKEGIRIQDVKDNGVIFETDQEVDEEEHFDDNPTWWSKDELLQYLEECPEQQGETKEVTAPSQFRNFDELMTHMKPIFEDKVHKLVRREGIGSFITELTSVSYHCEAFLDGALEPFDSSVLRGRPFLSRLNFDLMVPGLAIALKSMRQYERADFLVLPELAFGEIGCPPRIPGNATILYKVEILKIFAEGSLAHFESMTNEDRLKLSREDILKICDEERNSGNSYFNQRKFKEAAFRYRKAIQVLEPYVYNSGDEKPEDVMSILMKLYSNAALTYNKIDKPKVAINFCNRILKNDEKNVKAHYHKAVSMRLLGDCESARNLLLKALQLSPGNVEVAREMRRLEEQMKIDDESEKQLYTKMAAVFKKQNEKEKE